MIPYIKKLAATSSLNFSSDTIALENVMEGTDGAGVFNVTTEPESAKINDGQTWQHSDMHTFDLRILRTSDPDVESFISDTVLGPTSSNRAMQLFGLCGDGVLQTDFMRFEINKQFDSFETLALTGSIKSIKGYSGPLDKRFTPVYVGSNLLGRYDVRVGGGATDMIAGWVDEHGLATPGMLPDGQTMSFSTDEHNPGDPGLAVGMERIFLPVEATGMNIELTFSAVFTNKGADLVIWFNDLIIGEANAVTGSTLDPDTGRYYVTASVPANTKTVRVGVMENDGGSEDIALPCLRIGTSKEFTI